MTGFENWYQTTRYYHPTNIDYEEQIIDLRLIIYSSMAFLAYYQ